MKSILKKLQNFADNVTAFLTVAGIIIGLISIIFSSYEWTPENTLMIIIKYLSKHLIELWGITSTLLLLYVWLQYIRVKRQLNLVFTDDFKKPIEHNWDYIGPWRITDDNELFVTGSDEGGLTKKGAFWENYVFQFEAKILKKCIGVIIRAKDLQNYYMFQISTDSINPHRRVSVPVMKAKSGDQKEFTVDEIRVGWIVMNDISLPHRKSLDTWFKVKLIVKGQSLSIYINDEKIFNNDLLIENSSGKVGFRNVATEEALIRNVKVEII